VNSISVIASLVFLTDLS